MNTIETSHITKSFNNIKVVDDVSFDVRPGEIFGLLGPNGAGKTTTIRIILDIFKADSGLIKIFGGEMSELKKQKIGYLPEERGLYQDINLEQCLVYLATLKGMDKHLSQIKVQNYLEQFNLIDHRKKKIKELSKGMQQKAQLITALVHDPELIIIDEPFSALDPVNTQMVKDLLREQRALGKTIVMCTHQMHQVEELCDRIVLINRGQSVLYGNLSEIQKSFSGNDIHLRSQLKIPANIPGVKDIIQENSHYDYRIHLEKNITPQEFLKTLINRDINVDLFEIYQPSLDEIFIQIVTQTGNLNE
ncbi:MAG: ATP-binding cassette domain-containing protein [Anaerolineaceae bacterium]|nr:ATP-binding cassette domain-containing protein [Anaerolineaceae bacterium]